MDGETGGGQMLLHFFKRSEVVWPNTFDVAKINRFTDWRLQNLFTYYY